MNRISRFQIVDAEQWAGLTTENNLGYLGMLNRHLISDVIDNINEVNLGADFDRFMNQFPIHSIPKDVEFEWLLSGPDIKNYPLVSYDSDGAGTVPTKAGINFSSFYMYFSTRMFEPTDTIATDSKEIYQLRILDVKPSGQNWKYEVELLTGDPTLFVPADQLVVGKRFGKLYSPVEQTMSQRGGTVQHTTYFKMANRCSSIRMNIEVPANMMIQGKEEKGKMGCYFTVKDESGKTKKMTTWLNKLDWDFRTQFSRQKSYLGIYAKSNKTASSTYVQKGETGYEIKMGAGFYEQIAPSNIHYLNNWTLDQLEDILLGLSVGKLPQDQRRFVIATGEYGWKKFHKIVQAAGMPFASMNAGSRITGTGNDLRFGGQYVAVGFVNGIEVELRKMPFLDDPTFNTAQHPDGGLVSSYEMLIMDIGTSNGKPNVERVVVEGESNDIVSYVPGLRNPFSPDGSFDRPGMSANLKDAYQIGVMSIMGLKINNPTKLARVLPNFI